MLQLPIEGGCGCGAVRYSITEKPRLLTLCHCTTCQKRTGSAFAMTLVVLRAGVFVQGETITRDLKTGSGNINRHHFCNECLVRTHTEPNALPKLTFVRPGTLDNPHQFAPAAQIWSRSALKWALNNDIRCYEENIDDAAHLVAEWQSSL